MKRPDDGGGEGGHSSTGVVHVEANARAAEAEEQYGSTKDAFDSSVAGYRAYTDIVARTWGFGFFGKAIREASETLITGLFKDTTTHSTRETAKKMREISSELASKFGDNPSPIQEKCNDRLWTHMETDGDLERVTSDDLAPLFDPKHPEHWPNLILTGNHARASSTEHLTELMKGVERIADDAGAALHDGKPSKLDLLRLKVGDKSPQTKGKTIIALACHTEKDILLNGAELIERRCELKEDEKGNNDPAQRSLTHMSPAAMRLGKLMLKLLVEPDKNGGMLVDLDLATPKNMNDKQGLHRYDDKKPLVANAHKHTLVLREDAASIAQHIKLAGYSKAANTVADALRFLYVEMAALSKEGRLKRRDGKQLLPVLTTLNGGFPVDKTISTIIGNMGLLSLAPGEVPLTTAEKNIVGMKRVTILNKNDFTAGHMVYSDGVEKKYDPWSDRLITIEGTTDEMGHSITSALGKDDNIGYIMNPANRDKPDYAAAQDEVRAFFASNHRVNAVTTLCVSADHKLENDIPAGTENVLLLQFAPGVTRGDVSTIEAQVLAALKAQGFAEASIASDFANQRRIRVVLDTDGTDNPIVMNETTASGSPYGPIAGVDHAKLDKASAALRSLNTPDKNGLFFTCGTQEYLAKLAEEHPYIGGADVSVVSHQGKGIKGEGVAVGHFSPQRG